MAEITLPHLLRLAKEHGCSVTQQQAAAFLNQEGHAYEMWKHMMRAGVSGELIRWR
jgi:histidinol phosphatase-like PHP family hydrolase